MQVVRSVDAVDYQERTVVTVGTYDGVHLGHQAIIRALTQRAKALGGRSVVITFEPHPREVVGRGPVKRLTTPDERLALLDRMHVDLVLVLEFTYEFSRQSSRAFYERYVIDAIGLKEVIVGYDHMFGRDREAGVKELQAMGLEHGFTEHTVEPVEIDGSAVSSSRIREALMRGDVELAARCLGRPYALTGSIIRGEGRGKQIGFPTANIEPASMQKVLPAEGVYVVEVGLDDRKYFGMLNIGVRPTFETGLHRTIEVNIFELDEPLYDASMTVAFLKRLRQERKFLSTEDLISQLHRDRSESMKYLQERTTS